ncbi:DUF4185 domain-containing protein [Nocardioides sp. Kera G14]|uniref:DUF4185 domain-containing protein n=1 Tax=Nocardioides sp. Kera G14 TaxID=2884264 RepID=UPI001D108105|nr:DUF4185 domain-containing protein [Nocardioides sp. Kera G14]UDY24024.1 DUF4185 domain-containing protein [Nocardioides sp. Kera G14]
MRVGWRTQVLLVIVPTMVLAVALITLLPDREAASVAAPSRASETRCIPFSPATDVDRLNTLVGSLRGGGEFQGADVGADVELSDGRRLWVFGDTLQATSGGSRFVRNSMLVFDTSCASVVVPASHGAVIPDRGDGVGYWPMSIAKVARAGYDLIGVTANRVRSDDGKVGDAFAFHNLGPAVAVFIVPTGGVPQLLQVEDIGPDDTDRARPAWGAAVAVQGDWVYLYGTANSGQPLVFGYSLQVARVRADDILDLSKWRYWNGSAWGRSPSKAAVLIPAVGGVSQTLSVFEQAGSWYAVSKRDEFVGSDLVVWKAPAPTGPWVAGPVAAKIPSGSSELRYMPLAHPDLLPEPGTVVVSYSRNNTDVGKVAEDPFLYRPHFLRVPLP